MGGKGTYVLMLNLRHEVGIRVGALGKVRFPAGWYLYVGSAFGPGGLEARIARHIRRDKKLHWHIDYLREYAEICEVWTAPGHLECTWAGKLASTPGFEVVAPGFGASDCGCETHLFRWGGELPPGDVAGTLGAEQMYHCGTAK